MPHAVIILARQVINGSTPYPECIISQATSLVKMDDARRLYIAKLWTNYRTLLREYRSVKLKTRSPEYMAKTREILFKALGNDRDLHNDFHKCMNRFSGGYKDECFNFKTFTSKIEAFECEDISTMLRYTSCVNAKRFDDTLAPVAFIRWIPATELTEIVLFKLNTK